MNTFYSLRDDKELRYLVVVVETHSTSLTPVNL